MCDAEAVPRGDIGEITIELIARCETDGMDDAIKAIPLFAQLFEYLDDFVVACNVARETQIRTRAPAGSELFDAPLSFSF